MICRGGRKILYTYTPAVNTIITSCLAANCPRTTLTVNTFEGIDGLICLRLFLREEGFEGFDDEVVVAYRGGLAGGVHCPDGGTHIDTTQGYLRGEDVA